MLQQQVAPEYALSHITDLAKIPDADIPHFVSTLPGLIAMMKLAAADGTAAGVDLSKVMPVVRYTPDNSSTITLRSKTATVEASGDQMQASWNRTKQVQDCPTAADGKHHVVRDQDAIQHGCCQACGEVVHLG